MTTPEPGRSCPIAYRYQPQDLAGAASATARTLYVVGGLYGSVAALDAVLARAGAEASPVTLVFNGDFHYLDVDDGDFRAVAEGVRPYLALRGNVEAELADPSAEAGCGCGYPPYVADAVVARSNAVMARLRATARRHPDLTAQLAGLPRHLVVEVGGVRVGIVHGDLENLAGWRLALEAMEPGDEAVRALTGFLGPVTREQDVAGWLDAAGLRVLACTHTGLPYMQDVGTGDGTAVVVNNGTAALPCFAGTGWGVLTRICADPAVPPDALYGLSLGPLRVDALPVRYDAQRRKRELLASWPPGSPGHEGYAGRLTDATALRLASSARGRVRVHADVPD